MKLLKTECPVQHVPIGAAAQRCIMRLSSTLSATQKVKQTKMGKIHTLSALHMFKYTNKHLLSIRSD